MRSAVDEMMRAVFGEVEGAVVFFCTESATTEVYTRGIVGSVRCVCETDAGARAVAGV